MWKLAGSAAAGLALLALSGSVDVASAKGRGGGHRHQVRSRVADRGQPPVRVMPPHLRSEPGRVEPAAPHLHARPGGDAPPEPGSRLSGRRLQEGAGGEAARWSISFKPPQGVPTTKPAPAGRGSAVSAGLSAEEDYGVYVRDTLQLQRHSMLTVEGRVAC